MKARSDKGIPKVSDQAIIERYSWREPNSGCWLWFGQTNSDGYGRLGRNRTERQAHRLSYHAFVGPISLGTIIMHKCDTPACVNPAHLRPGSLSDNVQDAISKGRHVTKRGAAHKLAKLNSEAVEIILAEPRIASTQLAKLFGVSQRLINKVRAGSAWWRP